MDLKEAIQRIEGILVERAEHLRHIYGKEVGDITIRKDEEAFAILVEYSRRLGIVTKWAITERDEAKGLSRFLSFPEEKRNLYLNRSETFAEVHLKLLGKI